MALALAASGARLDSADTRFGVRSVNAEGPRVEFNGEAVFLRGYGGKIVMLSLFACCPSR